MAKKSKRSGVFLPPEGEENTARQRLLRIIVWVIVALVIFALAFTLGPALVPQVVPQPVPTAPVQGTVP
jgi:hypothetical protein